MTDLSVNHKSRLQVKPRIDHQLLGISDDCLIIQHFNINLSLSMGWGGALFFWVIGLPMALFLAIAPWMPPYGYRDGIAITSFIEKISGASLTGILVYFLFYVVIMGGTMIAITLGFSYFNLRLVKQSFSPVTFNRKTQTVSIAANGVKEEIEWERLSATIAQVVYSSGYVMHQSKVLRLHNLSKIPRIKIQIEGSLFVEELDDEEHSGAEANWEYIRQFMQQGPENLMIPNLPIIGIDHLDKQPMYSYNVKGSLKGHWFWPIFKEKNQHGVTLFFTLLFWPIKVIFFIPNLLSDWLWRRMCLRTLKDSKATPRHSLKKCGNNMLTANDAEKVISVEEASATKDLSYGEVKRRLQEGSASKPKQPSLALALLISLSVYVFLYFFFTDEALGDFLFGWILDYL